MSSDWKRVPLGSLVEVKHGFAFKSQFFSDSPTQYQLVTPGNFAIGGGFQAGNGKYYSGPVPPEYVLQQGQVIVTMTDLSKAADTLGYAAVVPATDKTVWLHNQRVGLLIFKDEELLVPQFLHYLMRSPEYRHHVVAGATGSTVKHTSPSRICDYEFRLPTGREQKDIADILGSLDNRITLLRETNKTLEAIAQAIFKSWFVDFDPVKAKMDGRHPAGMDEETAALFPDELVESELGLIPRGWVIGKLGELVNLRNERIKPTREVRALPYVPIDSIQSKSCTLQTFRSGDEARSSLLRFYKNDILFGAMRPYFHKVCIAPFDGVTRSTVFTFHPQNPKALGFALMQLYREETVAYATLHSEGTTIPYAKWTNSFERMPMVLPPLVTQSAFSEIVLPVIVSANQNIKKLQTLESLRDTLLPRLISGKLRVPIDETETSEV